jgi:NAD(P)-dependent dehydrogenase (short-subunit alcohol dehydrogenase family)
MIRKIAGSFGEFAPGTAIRESFDKALADAHQALAIAPDLAEGYLALALFFNGSLDFTRANDAYQHALALAPGNAEVLRESGHYAVLMGHSMRVSPPRAGRIINLGSLAGKEGLAGITAYSAASAGVIAFTKALSREVARYNVFVNCIAPGPIDTDMIRGLGSEVVDQMINDSPLRRLGQAREVAELVAWLCTDASRFNTGAVFDMSGGRARY